MQKKNLLTSNPYLKDPIECEALLIRSAVSSSAIEGIAASAFKGSYPARKKKIKASKTSIQSARSPR
jgi:hypothetical protein